MAAYLKETRRLMTREGHVVQIALGNGAEPDWAYTIGLHGRGLPEVIVIGGLSIPHQHGLLNEVADRMRAGDEFAPGHYESDLLEGYDAAFVEVVNTDSEYFAVANRLQANFRALQLVWPDHDNRFPWESGCEVPLDAQPLLGLHS